MYATLLLVYIVIRKCCCVTKETQVLYYCIVVALLTLLNQGNLIHVTIGIYCQLFIISVNASNKPKHILSQLYYILPQ
jgi:hypothetical protein